MGGSAGEWYVGGVRVVVHGMWEGQLVSGCREGPGNDHET